MIYKEDLILPKPIANFYLIIGQRPI